MTPLALHLAPDIVRLRPQQNPTKDGVIVHHERNPQRKKDQDRNLQRAERKQKERNEVEAVVLRRVLRNLNDYKFLQSLLSEKFHLEATLYACIEMVNKRCNTLTMHIFID